MRFAIVALAALQLHCDLNTRCDECREDNRSEPLLTVTAFPGEGSIDVGRRPRITLEFGNPMETETTIAAFMLQDDAGASVGGVVFFEENQTRLVFIPDDTLAAGAAHTIALAMTARSIEGLRETSPRTWHFTTTTLEGEELPQAAIDAITGTVASLDLAANGDYILSGTTTGAVAIDWVGAQVLPAGVTPAAAWPAAAASEGAWQYAWAVMTIEPAPEGNYTVYVLAVDKAGGQTQTSGEISVDVRGPSAPSAAIPASWKFRTLPVGIVTEPQTSLAVTVDGAVIAGSPFAAGDDGQVALNLTLGQRGTTAIIEIQPFDAELNAGTALTATVTRVDYDCLSEAVFPASGDAALSLTDDDEGHVAVTYRLDSGLVDDTVLSAATPTTNSGIASFLGLGSNPDFRILLRFADGVVPVCAGVTSATLTLRSATPCAQCLAPSSIMALALQRSWVEREATWEVASDGMAWEQAGAGGTVDRDANGTLGVLVGDKLQFDARSFAQEGVVMVAQDAGSRTLYASEHSDATLRPTLQLELVEPGD